MSSFEDVETENGRRPWAQFQRIRECTGRAPTRPTRSELRNMDRIRGVEVEPIRIVCLPPTRRARTSLGAGLLRVRLAEDE